MGLQAEKAVGRVLPPYLWDWSLCCEHAPTQMALEYWRSRCRDDKIPAASDIVPSGMSKFLPHILLVDIHRESDADVQYCIRLAGTHVEEILGPISGRDIRSFLAPDLLVRWQEIFGEVVKAGKSLRVMGRVSYANKSWLSGEALLAPLCDETGAVSRLFVVMSFQSTNN